MPADATATPTGAELPLDVRDVVKTFGQGGRTVTALAGVSLAVTRGRFVAVMGASGSGKSTLLHLMAGLTRADRGEVRIGGTDVTRLADGPLTRFRRRHIGLVFQSFNLIPTLTAEENVLLPLMLDGRDDRGARDRAARLLEYLRLGHRLRHRPDALSGGEQQRVAIARALVTEPDVILADEPTGNLDSVNSVGVCELLRELARTHGRTVVMVTHEPSVAAYADEVAVLRDGRLVDRFPNPPTPDAADVSRRYQAALTV
ncbi:MAG: ABC transporter ATP-binding protein [Tepidisphaerales bacterium]